MLQNALSPQEWSFARIAVNLKEVLKDLDVL